MIAMYNEIKQFEMCEPNYLQDYLLTWKHEARFDHLLQKGKCKPVCYNMTRQELTAYRAV